MIDGTEKKGLVVEQHEDRVILNTEQGEIPVMREQIKDIFYDDQEQTFLQIGESHEAAQRWGEALAFYEKALQVNPDFEDAKKAAIRVRNQFWSKAIAGPSNEVEQKQALYDAWGKGKSARERKDSTRMAEARSLREGPGLVLEQKGVLRNHQKIVVPEVGEGEMSNLRSFLWLARFSNWFFLVSLPLLL